MVLRTNFTKLSSTDAVRIFDGDDDVDVQKSIANAICQIDVYQRVRQYITLYDKVMNGLETFSD